MAQVTDNTAQWNMMKLAETGIPLGFEYFSINPNVPLGSLPLIGGTYSRTLYKDLWDWVQTQTGYLKTEAEWTILFNKNNGNVPFYSSGDGSTTFRVPSLKCWVRGADSISEVGGYLAAGLPNIEGQLGLWLVKAFSVISNVGNKDLQSVITRMDEIDNNRLKLCIYTD